MDPTDIYGRKPLHYAAQHGHLLICQFILENTIFKNPQSIGDKTTPLHLAASAGHWKICQLLFEHFGRLEGSWYGSKKDSKGNTPLHHAANHGHILVCWVILNNVDDKNPCNDEGITPFDLALKKCFFAICNLISSSDNMEL